MVMAWTFAPAITPLCAMGVAMEIPLAQLWPGPPGMFDGKRSVTVGTFQRHVADIVRTAARGLILPPSSPVPSSAGDGRGARSSGILVARPRTGCFSSSCIALGEFLVVVGPGAAGRLS